MCWRALVIPALLGRLRQEDHQLKPSLSNFVTLISKYKGLEMKTLGLLPRTLLAGHLYLLLKKTKAEFHLLIAAVRRGVPTGQGLHLRTSSASEGHRSRKEDPRSHSLPNTQHSGATTQLQASGATTQLQANCRVLTLGTLRTLSLHPEDTSPRLK